MYTQLSRKSPIKPYYTGDDDNTNDKHEWLQKA